MTIIEGPCSDSITAMIVLIRACETIVHPDLPATNKTGETHSSKSHDIGIEHEGRTSSPRGHTDTRQTFTPRPLTPHNIGDVFHC